MWKTGPNPSDMNLLRGRAAAIMLSVEAYERLAHSQDLLSLRIQDQTVWVVAGDKLHVVGIDSQGKRIWHHPVTVGQ